MVRHPPCLAATLLVACLAVAASPAPAADLVVEGCNVMEPGEVGVREALGNVGEFVQVPITVNTTSAIEAFTVDLVIPTDLLVFVDALPGDLTAGFSILDGDFNEETGKVRIGGFGLTPIPAGVAGRLAVVVFEVVAAGTGAFATDRLADGLSGYVSCEDVHGTTRITPTEWGKVKALYRN